MNFDFKVTLQIIITLSLLIGGWVYSYGSLNTMVQGQAVEITSLKSGMNKLDTIELRINANTKANEKFLTRFDDFLDAQTEINKQLVTITVRQEYLMKRLEGNK